jgi:hypothetical protein
MFGKKLINKRVRVLWEPTNTWYKATVTKYKRSQHFIKYDNQEEEWLNLDADDVQFELELPAAVAATPAAVAAPPAAAPAAPPAAASANTPVTGTSTTAATGTTATTAGATFTVTVTGSIGATAALANAPASAPASAPVIGTINTPASAPVIGTINTPVTGVANADITPANTVTPASAPARVVFEPLQKLFNGSLFFRATKPSTRQTIVVAALPFLVKGGLLKKDWKPPESKRYRTDVKRLNLPLSFVNTKNFGDKELTTHALTVLRSEWKRTGSNYRFQAASRICSAESLLLAMKHHPKTDTSVYRDLQLFLEEQQRAVNKMDKREVTLANARAKTSNNSIAAPIHALRQKKGKRPQMRQQHGESLLVKSVKVHCQKLASLDMRTVVLPNMEEWSTVQSTSIKARFETTSKIMTRIASHSISTGRMEADATAATFFNSPLLGSCVCDFFESHAATGATSTGRLPMARGARMATYLHAVSVSGTPAEATAVQNSIVVFRTYKMIWTDANRDRAAKESEQDWNLPLLELAQEVVDAVVAKGELFFGSEVVNMDQQSFASLVQTWSKEHNKKRKTELRRRVVAARAYSHFVLSGQFILQLALKVGMRPLGFVELDLLTKEEWDARVSRTGRRPQVESAIVQLPSGDWMLSRNSGKGARSQSAAPSARNALYTCDPITGQQGHLFGLNFDGAKKAHEILVTCESTGLVDRSYLCSDRTYSSTQALFTRTHNNKFICEGMKRMFAPPYVRPGNSQGLTNVPSTGEGGKLSKFFTTTLNSLFKNLNTECTHLLRFKLKEPITIEKLGLSVGGAAVARRWSMRPALELTIYDVRRALSTSVLSARDASRSWAAAGGSSFLPLAMAEVLSKHLSIANHSEQVAQQYYKQSSPIESARLFSDANMVQKGTKTMEELASFDLSGTPAEVEVKIERMHRFIGWIQLSKLAKEGRVRWNDEKKNMNFWWVLVIFFAIVLVKTQWPHPFSAAV